MPRPPRMPVTQNPMLEARVVVSPQAALSFQLERPERVLARSELGWAAAAWPRQAAPAAPDSVHSAAARSVPEHWEAPLRSA